MYMLADERMRAKAIIDKMMPDIDKESRVVKTVEFFASQRAVRQYIGNEIVEKGMLPTTIGYVLGGMLTDMGRLPGCSNYDENDVYNRLKHHSMDTATAQLLVMLDKADYERNMEIVNDFNNFGNFVIQAIRLGYLAECSGEELDKFLRKFDVLTVFSSFVA